MKYLFFTIFFFQISFLAVTQNYTTETEICGIPKEVVVNKKMVHISGYDYSIGTWDFNRNTRQMQCFMKKTGNEIVYKEMRGLSTRKRWRVITTIGGIGMSAIGLLYLSGGEIESGAALMAVGVPAIGVSIYLARKNKKMIRKIPDYYNVVK